VGRSTD
jgi:hypothetical protein